MIDEIAGRIYDLAAQKLHELGEEGTRFPFSREEFLHCVNLTSLVNALDYEDIDSPDDMVFARNVYLFGFRRTPSQADEEMFREMREAAGSSAEFRRILLRNVQFSSEGRGIELCFRHSPYNDRLAVRPVQRPAAKEG